MVAGRPRDLEDVKGILAKTQPIDIAYVRRWLDEFGRALEQPLSERFEDLLK